MISTAAILKNAADHCGVERVRYADAKAPASMSHVTSMVFLGDLRSAVVLSSLVLKRYREEDKGSKYFVLCSWPGLQDLFPYVDEYWSVGDEVMKNLYWSADRLDNRSPGAPTVARKMTRFFDTVDGPEAAAQYYDDGLTGKFFERFKTVKCFKPALPSSVVLGGEFSREANARPGRKVFVYPSLAVNHWNLGRVEATKVGPDFWIALVEALLGAGYVPVVCRSPLCHELSAVFVDKCVYVTPADVGQTLAAMRACDAVVDIFTGISRLAITARCPYVCCDERTRYVGLKEYEFDDLCARGVPREYIFSFSTIIGGGGKADWKHSILDAVLAKLDSLSSTDRNAWPTASEVESVVPYDSVREVVSRRMGTKFIRVPRI
jgi:hypothetical protein